MPDRPPARQIPPIRQQRCPHCDAMVAVSLPKCWLCHAPRNEFRELPEKAPPETPAAGPEPHGPATGGPDSIQETVFLAATALVALLVAALGVGIAGSNERQLLIPYLFVVVPAALITLGTGLVRRMNDLPVTWTQRFLTFMISSAVMMMIAFLFAVAVVIAFFFMCLKAISGGG